jgi:hypothetical protein
MFTQVDIIITESLESPQDVWRNSIAAKIHHGEHGEHGEHLNCFLRVLRALRGENTLAKLLGFTGK